MPFGTGSGKSGYCVPYQCQSDKDCLTIGDACTSGSLSGTCNKENDKGICRYLPALAIATCGKKRSKKRKKNEIEIDVFPPRPTIRSTR